MKQMFSANKYNKSYDILIDILNYNGELLGLGPVKDGKQVFRVKWFNFPAYAATILTNPANLANLTSLVISQLLLTQF